MPLLAFLQNEIRSIEWIEIDYHDFIDRMLQRLSEVKKVNTGT